MVKSKKPEPMRPPGANDAILGKSNLLIKS